jgi:hypothetical protein
MAYACITGGATVEVWHGKVPEPVQIRFAWHRNSLDNVWKREELASMPFHTDQTELLKKPG